MLSLVFVLGPTASGKTDCAGSWAEKTSACIVNGDSIQVYKDLNIGSAKPDFKKYPKVKWFLFNEISAPQIWTAGDFRRKALKILHQNLPRKKVFVVGGSGFYIQALEKGMYPGNPSPSIKKNMDNQELSYLYELLKKKDIKRARQISPKDKYRIYRSLNIMEREGKTFSQIKEDFKEEKLPWPYMKVGLSISQQELLKRVKARTEKMLKAGLVEETEYLLSRGLNNWRPIKSVGYKEVLLYLEGKIKKADLADKIVSGTMSLAKKQKTWFKKDKSVKWFDFNRDAKDIYKQIFK